MEDDAGLAQQSTGHHTGRSHARLPLEGSSEALVTKTPTEAKHQYYLIRLLLKS